MVTLRLLWRLLSFQFEADGFAVVADEEVVAGEAGLVPGFAGEGGETGEDFFAGHVGFGDDDFAAFALDEEGIADAEHLAVAVAGATPDLCSRS